MATFNIHAGHAPDGKKGSGAVGIVKESIVDRQIKDAVIAKLRALGHTVYDCTCESGGTATEVLKVICSKANAYKADLDISIHLNCYNGNAKGTEVLVYKLGGKAEQYAKNIVNSICELGYVNRGVKIRNDLYYLKNTKNTALLIEAFFCDSQDDVNLYNLDAMANAIVKGLTGQIINETVTPEQTPAPQPKPSGNELIKAVQQHSINFTSHAIAVDGIKGKDTLANIRRCVQHAINLDYKKSITVDGYFQTKSKSAFGNHYVKRGETQYMVTALEIALMCHGYNPNGVECPGKFGSGLEACVKQYQADHGLTVDGKAGKNTFFSLMEI